MHFEHKAFHAVFFTDIFDRILDALDFGFLEFATETFLNRTFINDSRFQFTHDVDTAASMFTPRRADALQRRFFVLIGIKIVISHYSPI